MPSVCAASTSRLMSVAERGTNVVEVDGQYLSRRLSWLARPKNELCRLGDIFRRYVSGTVGSGASESEIEDVREGLSLLQGRTSAREVNEQIFSGRNQSQAR